MARNIEIKARVSGLQDLARRAAALASGVLGEVRKERRVYLAGQTRIHVDEVAGLGGFLELEVVLRDGQDEAAGEAIARELMMALGVAEEQLVRVAYLDLLLAAPPE